MNRTYISLILAVLLMSACSDTRTDEALAEGEPSGQEAPDSEHALTASPLTIETYGIARWEAQAVDDAVAVVGLSEAGERVFAFEFASREGEMGSGLRVINAEKLTDREIQISDAYFNDVTLQASLDNSTEDLTFKGGGPGCGVCGEWGTDVKFSCYALVLMCQDHQFCPSNDGLSNVVEKKCGDLYVCGACFGFSW
ncbi:MAG TPA: hypothetical protein VFG30_32460 [Polyangiales bacterium]|nr:hypothetical protein [Polyangiales bacterium]